MTNLPIPAGQVEVTQADCEAISRIATEICDNGSCRCRTGAQEQAIASRIWQWCRHRLLASTTGEERAASLDHADTLETIQNADDGWQAKGYSSALAEVRDMANVGRALMEALPEGYSYMDCPSEIVSDLQSEIADLTTPSTPPVPEVAAIPVGMKLVPVEPTEAMIAAAKRIVGDDGYVIGPWKAMIAAAPSTPDTRSADVPVGMKPCPFCGGEGDIESQPSYSQAANTYDRYRGWCDHCGFGLDWHSYEVDAITAWNTRASLSPTHTVSDMGVDDIAALMFEAVVGRSGRRWRECEPALQDRYRESARKFLVFLTADKPEDTQELREAAAWRFVFNTAQQDTGSKEDLRIALRLIADCARSLLNKGNDDGK